MTMVPNDQRAMARESARTWQWQRRLLPIVLAAVGALALFFFVSTFVQLERLNDSVTVAPDRRIDAALEQIAVQAQSLPPADAAELLKWRTMVLLESDVVRHRYAQVNATLLMRAWTRHIGFVTGMIMTFMGALFVLSKLSEAETKLDSAAGGAKIALATSSPGLVLAVLGTALMLATLAANFEFSTTDVPVYLTGNVAAVAPKLPDPASLPGSDADEKDLFGSGKPSTGQPKDTKDAKAVALPPRP